MRASGSRAWLSLPWLLLLSTTAYAADGFDCSDLLIKKTHFDLSKLGGVKKVHRQEVTDPTIRNTTFAIDICKPLPMNDDVEKDYQCQQGARVCSVEEIWRGGKLEDTDEVRNIAGDFFDSGRHLEAKLELLGHGSAHKDKDQEGLRMILHGGLYPLRKAAGQKQYKQQAIIEFVCNDTVTGNEGFEASDSRFGDRRRAKGDEGDDEDEDEPSIELPHLDAGKSLQFESFEMEDEIETLRITWNTKYACLDNRGEDDDNEPPAKSGGWGFFTWLIIVVFLLAAAYIIFGSWLNYNRYGARGWDLIPHGDTIRDLPYILKDFFGNIMGRLQGGGSRGGYSAV